MAGIENTVGNKTEKVFHQPAAKRRDITDDEKRAYSRPENPFGFLRLRWLPLFFFRPCPSLYPRRRLLQRRDSVCDGKFRLPLSVRVPDGVDNKSGIFCFGKSFFFHLSLQFFSYCGPLRRLSPIHYTGNPLKSRLYFVEFFLIRRIFRPENSIHYIYIFFIISHLSRKHKEKTVNIS